MVVQQIEKFLQQVLPNEETRAVLQEYVGYIFIKNLNLEKFVILLGDGGNGKSVFFKILKAIIGENNQQITNYAKLMFNANHLPSDIEYSEAWFRRFLIIDFNVNIKEVVRNGYNSVMARCAFSKPMQYLGYNKKEQGTGGFTYFMIEKQSEMNL